MYVSLVDPIVSISVVLNIRHFFASKYFVRCEHGNQLNFQGRTNTSCCLWLGYHIVFELDKEISFR